MGRSTASGHSSPAAQGDVEASWEPSAADWDALTSPPAAGQQQQQQQASSHPEVTAQHQASAAVSGGMSLSGQQPQPLQHRAVGSAAQDESTSAAGAAGAAAADGVEADAATEYTAPTVQDFYMLTSPAGGADGSTGSSSSSMFGSPLRVSVLTESDALALQHMQQQRGQSSSSSGGYFAEPDEASALSFDVFCSTSSSKGLMSLSLVVRESAGLDNVFVGVTTTNQADQRGLQVRCGDVCWALPAAQGYSWQRGFFRGVFERRQQMTLQFIRACRQAPQFKIRRHQRDLQTKICHRRAPHWFATESKAELALCVCLLLADPVVWLASGCQQQHGWRHNVRYRV